MIRGSSLHPPESRRGKSLYSPNHYGAADTLLAPHRSDEESVRVWRSSLFDCPPQLQRRSSSAYYPGSPTNKAGGGEGGARCRRRPPRGAPAARDLSNSQHSTILSGMHDENETVYIPIAPSMGGEDSCCYHYPSSSGLPHQPQSSTTSTSPAAPLLPIFDSEGSLNKQQLGIKTFEFRRLAVFHTLLSLSWKSMVALSLSAYLMVVTLFAVLYFLWGSVCGVELGSDFAVRPKVLSYYFSIVSLAANGGYLGEPEAMTNSSHFCFTGRAVLVGMCSYTNIVFVGLVAALIVGKASNREKLSRRIIFSDFCVLNEVKARPAPLRRLHHLPHSRGANYSSSLSHHLQVSHQSSYFYPPSSRRTLHPSSRQPYTKPNKLQTALNGTRRGRSRTKRVPLRLRVSRPTRSLSTTAKKKNIVVTEDPHSNKVEEQKNIAPSMEELEMTNKEEDVLPPGKSSFTKTVEPSSTTSTVPAYDTSAEVPLALHKSLSSSGCDSASSSDVDASSCATTETSRSSGSSSSASSSTEDEEEGELEPVYPEWRLDFRLTDMEPLKPTAGGCLRLYCVTVEQQNDYWESKRRLRMEELRRREWRHAQLQLREARWRRKQRHKRARRERRERRREQRTERRRREERKQHHRSKRKIKRHASVSSTSCSSYTISISSGSREQKSSSTSARSLSPSSSCTSRSFSSTESKSSSRRKSRLRCRSSSYAREHSYFCASSSSSWFSSSSCPNQHTSSCSSIHAPSEDWEFYASVTTARRCSPKNEDIEDEEQCSASWTASRFSNSCRTAKERLSVADPRRGNRAATGPRRRGRSGKPPRGSTAPTVAPSEYHSEDVEEDGMYKEEALMSSAERPPQGRKKRKNKLHSRQALSTPDYEGKKDPNPRRGKTARSHELATGLEAVAEASLNSSIRRTVHGAAAAAWRRSLVQRTSTNASMDSDGHPGKPFHSEDTSHFTSLGSQPKKSSRGSVDHRRRVQKPSGNYGGGARSNPMFTSSSSPARVRTCVQELSWTCAEEQHLDHPVSQPHHHPHHHSLFGSEKWQNTPTGTGSLHLWYPVVISHHIDRFSPLFRFMFDRYCLQQAAVAAAEAERECEEKEDKGNACSTLPESRIPGRASRSGHHINKKKETKKHRQGRRRRTADSASGHRPVLEVEEEDTAAMLPPFHEAVGGRTRRARPLSESCSARSPSSGVASSLRHSESGRPPMGGYAPFQIVAVYEAADQDSGSPILARKTYTPFEMMQSYRFSSKLVQMDVSKGFHRVVLDYHFFNTMVPLHRPRPALLPGVSSALPSREPGMGTRRRPFTPKDSHSTRKSPSTTVTAQYNPRRGGAQREDRHRLREPLLRREARKKPSVESDRHRSEQC